MKTRPGLLRCAPFAVLLPASLLAAAAPPASVREEQAVELSPFQILWRARRLTDALGEDVVKEIRDLRLPQVTRITLGEVGRHRDAVADFAAA